jgi:hypothetical protein
MAFDERYWKLYREERKKLGPFKVALSPQQITHIARTARKRHTAEKA